MYLGLSNKFKNIMKTIKTNTILSLLKIDKTSLLKRGFILIAILVISGLSFKTKAQCMNYTWTNNSGCDWNITFYDNTGTAIALSVATATALSGPVTVPSGGNCFACNANMINGRIDFTNSCGCTISFNLLAGGTVLSVGTVCSGMGCSLISCSGSPTTSSITVTQTTTGVPCLYEYIITIN
jgi:hypothetical protein